MGHRDWGLGGLPEIVKNGRDGVEGSKGRDGMGWKKMGDGIWVGGDGRKVGWDDGREEGWGCRSGWRG